jgi:hypothetical protein
MYIGDEIHRREQNFSGQDRLAFIVSGLLQPVATPSASGR